MININRILKCQYIYISLSIGYLLASLLFYKLTGSKFSAAAILPSIMSFFVYLAIVETHRFDNKYIYKFLMIIPIIGYGYGGVIMNVTRYMDTGLEFYFSFSAWLVAVLINLFGTIVNIIAIMYKPVSSQDSEQ